MLFNSFEYFLFFILVIPLYYFIRSQAVRIGWLLLASCFFYMYFVPKFILILCAVILIDYSSGIAISRQKTRAGKRFFLGLSISSNLAILFFFKYFNFFVENVELLSGTSLFRLNILLPIGLSFHTFQSLSYIIEVYRGNQPAEKRLDVFALYVMFFPQLVAGPIERPQNILHQLKEKKQFDPANFIKGIQLISLGLVKKCVIADRLSIYVDGVFTSLPQSSSAAVLLAVIFFSFQIYFDFSGYSDIALGSAKCMGIDLMLNFNKPYLSESIKEFWTRWHISLSSWFKDYVFIPLGGNRVSTLRYFRNIMIVFALSGLWHGASWNFVLWGVFHGILVFISGYTKWSFKKLSASLVYIDIALNFMIVALLWVFFRSPDIATTKIVFAKLLHLFSGMPDLSFIRQDFGVFSLLVALLAFMYMLFLSSAYARTANSPGQIRPALHLSLNFVLIFTLGIFNNQSFIYFQF